MDRASNLRRIKEQAALPKEKKRYQIPKVSKKRQAKLDAEKASRGEDETEQQKWYEKIMQSEMPVCWETGEKIDTRDKLGWHGSVAHCLPKSLFPSIACHPMNYMILKMWGGTHARYDASWESASKMKVWPHACKMFNILYPLLTTEEKRKLPDIIIQEIKPEVYNAWKRVRISVVGRRWVYCFFGRENGVFWFPVKIEKRLFPKMKLNKDQIFVFKSDNTIGKQVKP